LSAAARRSIADEDADEEWRTGVPPVTPGGDARPPSVRYSSDSVSLVTEAGGKL
jgi:hypothetical protein